MTTTEHLEKIKAKCQERIDICEGRLIYAEAGWKSTIAAIEGLQKMYGLLGEPGISIADAAIRFECNVIRDAILASWPESTLAIV